MTGSSFSRCWTPKSFLSKQSSLWMSLEGRVNIQGRTWTPMLSDSRETLGLLWSNRPGSVGGCMPPWHDGQKTSRSFLWSNQVHWLDRGSRRGWWLQPLRKARGLMFPVQRKHHMVGGRPGIPSFIVLTLLGKKAIALLMQQVKGHGIYWPEVEFSHSVVD